MKETKQTGSKKDSKVAATPNIFVFTVVIVIIIAFLFVGDVPAGIGQLIKDAGKEKIVNDDGTIAILKEAQVNANGNDPNLYVGKVLNEKIQLGRNNNFSYQIGLVQQYFKNNAFQGYQQAMAIFNGEVNKIIAMHNARKMNIYLSEERLIKKIGNSFKDADGDIDFRAMEKEVQRVNQLKEQVEQDMLYEHYTTDMFVGLPVDKEEALRNYKEENRLLNISYINLRTDNVAPEKLEEYFNNNRADYRRYRVTSLVFKEEKDAEAAINDILADPTKFNETGNKLKEEDKVINFQYGTTAVFFNTLENDELRELVKGMEAGKIGDKVVTLKNGPSIIKLEEVVEGDYANAEVAAKVSNDYLAANAEEVESSNLAIAQEIFTKIAEVKDSTSDMKSLAESYGAVYSTADYIAFMGGNFPHLQLDATDDLNFMIKAFKAGKGTVLEPYKHDNGVIVVLVEGLNEISNEKFEDLYDSLYKKYSTGKAQDIEADFYKEERKKHKIVDNSRSVFGELFFSQNIGGQ